MTAPKKGDRVRVEYDATYVDGGTWPAHTVEFTEGVDRDYDYRAGVPSSAKITVLPRPVRVGDVATREVLDALPRGSVVRTRYGGVGKAFTFKGERRWEFTGSTGTYDSDTVVKSFDVATVIFIPDPK